MEDVSGELVAIHSINCTAYIGDVTMDSINIDGLVVTPASLRIYEELIDIALPHTEESAVFPKKANTLSYAFAKDGIAIGYYKILSAQASETPGLTLFTLHKQ